MPKKGTFKVMSKKLQRQLKGLYTQGLNQSDIAKLAGVCQATICRIHKGERLRTTTHAKIEAACVLHDLKKELPSWDSRSDKAVKMNRRALAKKTAKKKVTLNGDQNSITLSIEGISLTIRGTDLNMTLEKS